MRLPSQLPINEEDRKALGEFYNNHSTKQWFDKAEIVEQHPTHMKRTLVLNVNFTPAFEMKEILSFTHKYNLGLDVISSQNNV